MIHGGCNGFSALPGGLRPEAGTSGRGLACALFRLLSTVHDRVYDFPGRPATGRYQPPATPARSPSKPSSRSLGSGQAFQPAAKLASRAVTASRYMGWSSSAGEYLLAGTSRPSASAMARTWCGPAPQQMPT